MRQKLILLIVCLTFAVIVLGGYTRLTDAGLGCPDWPGCYGQVLAPSSDKAIVQASAQYPHAPVDVSKAWTEMVHRYFASSLGFFILILAAITHFSKTAQPSEKWLTKGLLALVIFQGALGMWTVTLKLFPLVVMSHLLGGILTLSLLWILWHIKSPSQYKMSPFSPKRLIGFTIFALVIQIALGGWTSTNYAALSCPNFPFCAESFFPQFDWQAFDFWGALAYDNPLTYLSLEARQTIHMLHRMGALVVTLLIMACSFSLMKFRIKEPSLRQLPILNWLMILLLVVQVVLGITNVLAQLPLSIAMLHHSVAVLLLMLMLKIYMALPKKGIAYA